MLRSPPPRLATAVTVLYPNLKALPATDPHFDTIMAGDGSTHHVLRLSSTVWNNGEGALEVQGGEQGTLFQRLYDSAGNSRLREIPNGAILFHPTHDHYHFNSFADVASPGCGSIASCSLSRSPLP